MALSLSDLPPSDDKEQHRRLLQSAGREPTMGAYRALQSDRAACGRGRGQPNGTGEAGEGQYVK